MNSHVRLDEQVQMDHLATAAFVLATLFAHDCDYHHLVACD